MPQARSKSSSAWGCIRSTIMRMMWRGVPELTVDTPVASLENAIHRYRPRRSGVGKLCRLLLTFRPWQSRFYPTQRRGHFNARPRAGAPVAAAPAPRASPAKSLVPVSSVEESTLFELLSDDEIIVISTLLTFPLN